MKFSDEGGHIGREGTEGLNEVLQCTLIPLLVNRFKPKRRN